MIQIRPNLAEPKKKKTEKDDGDRELKECIDPSKIIHFSSKIMNEYFVTEEMTKVLLLVNSLLYFTSSRNEF